MSRLAAEAPLSLRARILHGYGPLAVLVAIFALMAALLPSVVVKQAGPATAGGSDQLPTDILQQGPEPTGGTAAVPGQTAQPGTAGSTKTVPGAAAKPAIGACAGRDKQVPGDPYSPPCIAFSGDNGGVTTRGVTGDKIILSARILNEKGFQQTLAALAGAEITDGPEDVKRTIQAYIDYFNQRFQFYGRKLEVVFYNGKGSTTNELLGGGQAEAQADAIHVAQEVKAFAELNGATAPFTDALFRQKVVAFGTPYLSRAWHVQRRPYNWSLATDCSIVAETTGEFYARQLGNKPAKFAGGDLTGKTRKVAGLAPENPWYQECVDDAKNVIEKEGSKLDVRIAYRLDINSMSNQAASVVARLKSEGVTTILCGCDPIFPVFLSTKAAEQNYKPEWIIVGSALTDHDVVGQLMEQDQWSRAFGVSYLGTIVPQRAGLGYAAYKTVRQDEPAFAAELIYAEMYMVAIGIQLAGPNLTPESYERGMFSYPGGTGPYGTWGFGPRAYTPTIDGRIIWWDPNAISVYNNKKGAYRESYGGKRFPLGTIPREDAPVFTK